MTRPHFRRVQREKESFMMYFNANERRRAAQAFGSIEDLKIKSLLQRSLI